MSACNRKKHVINETLNDRIEINQGQTLVKILNPRGNYLYEARTADNQRFLVSMPTKFRSTIWIKQGSFVVVESIEEGNKVKGEIIKVLLKQHVRQMKKEQKWFHAFDTENDDDYDDDDDDDDHHHR